jgi:hypothetical protein
VAAVAAPASSAARIPTTLVTGATARAREAAIAAAIDPALPTAVLLEGLPDGDSTLADAGDAHLTIARIAPGCPCCSGNLVMRVTLDRLLRQRPQRLFIALADTAHLDQVRAFLAQEPYGKLLSLTCIH